MKVLVLGSTGMAGHVITKYLEEYSGLDISNLSFRRKLNEKTIILDVMDIQRLDSYLDTESFDVIVNCIGILNKQAEEKKDQAVLLNSYLPHFLERKYESKKTKIIHISTDCVFSGNTGSYREDAFRDGDSFYDRTKAVGEVINRKDLTFRMSIIGPDMDMDGIGLFNWFMKMDGPINGYVNAIWTGVTTLELAKAILAAMKSNLSGLYHLVPDIPINKFDLLKLFIKYFKNDNIQINRYEGFCANKSLINTRKDFNYVIPTYDLMIYDMLSWVNEHKTLYPHYFNKV